MLVMKYKAITSSHFGSPVQRSNQLRIEAMDFIRSIGAEKVVSICEHLELSMLAIWYREEE